MPGVAGVAEAGNGVRRGAGLVTALRTGAGAGLRAATVTTGGAGAEATCVCEAQEATPAVRDTVAPRSAQRSGSSGHTVAARTIGATSALAVKRAATR